MGKLYKRTTTPTFQTALHQLRAHRALTAFFTDFLQAIGLSLSQWVLLGILSEKGSIRPAQIAGILGVKPPVVTTLVQELHHKGLLQRAPHPTDSRSHVIMLTPKGSNVVIVTEKRLRGEFRAFMHELTLPENIIYARAIVKLAAKTKE